MVKVIRATLIAIILFDSSAHFAISEQIPAVSRTLCNFGYFGAAVAGIGKGNYIQDVASYSTFSFQDTELFSAGMPKLATAERLGLKVIISSLAHQVFYDSYFRLRGDYADRWRKFQDKIKPHIGSVLAFYPFDEPLWHAESLLPCSRSKRCTSDERLGARREMIAKVEFVNSLLKEKFPSIPIMVVEAYPIVFAAAPEHIENLRRGGAVHPLHLPRGYDWIGADCYGNFDHCGAARTVMSDGTIVKNGSVSKLYAILMTNMSSEQKLAIVPDARHISDRAGNLVSENKQLEMVQTLRKYSTLANQDSRVIVEMPFLFSTIRFPAGRVMVGAEDLPLVRGHLEMIGREIKDNTACRR